MPSLALGSLFRPLLFFILKTLSRVYDTPNDIVNSDIRLWDYLNIFDNPRDIDALIRKEIISSNFFNKMFL